MQAKKKFHYQMCQCGFKNKTADTKCQICESKFKSLQPYKRALSKLTNSKVSSPTAWAIAGVLAVFLTGVNVYCVWKSQSCYTAQISKKAEK